MDRSQFVFILAFSKLTTVPTCSKITKIFTKNIISAAELEQKLLITTLVPAPAPQNNFGSTGSGSSSGSATLILCSCPKLRRTMTIVIRMEEEETTWIWRGCPAVSWRMRSCRTSQPSRIIIITHSSKVRNRSSGFLEDEIMQDLSAFQDHHHHTLFQGQKQVQRPPGG